MAILIGTVTADYDESDAWNNPDHACSTTNEQIVAACYDWGPPTAVSYNGNAMTLIATVGTYLKVWGLLAYYTVAGGVLDFSGHNGPGVVMGVPLTGLRALTAYDAGATGSGSGSSWNLVVNGAPGWLAIAGAGHDGENGVSVTGGVINAVVGGANSFCIGYQLMTGSTVNFAFTAGEGGNYNCAGIAIPPTRLAGSPMWWS